MKNWGLGLLALAFVSSAASARSTDYLIEGKLHTELSTINYCEYLVSIPLGSEMRPFDLYDASAGNKLVPLDGVHVDLVQGQWIVALRTTRITKESTCKPLVALLVD